MLNYKNVMTINSIMAAYFGFGSLLIPELFWGIYGLEVAAEGVWGLRIIGILVLSNMYLVWSSRNLNDAGGRRLIANFVVMVWVLYGLLALWGQLVGVFNLLNWTNIVGSALFAFLTFRVRSEEMQIIQQKAATG